MLRRTNRKVRYYVEDGPTIEGVEAGRTRSDYIVWCPRIVDAEKESGVEVTGHVEIERRRVLWRQVVS